MICLFCFVFQLFNCVFLEGDNLTLFIVIILTYALLCLTAMINCVLLYCFTVYDLTVYAS